LKIPVTPLFDGARSKGEADPVRMAKPSATVGRICRPEGGYDPELLPSGIGHHGNIVTDVCMYSGSAL